MKAQYNHKLRELASKPVLHGASTPLFICDEKLYICMKSIGAEKSIKQPITGSNLETYMDESLKKQILEMNGGWLCGTIYFNSAELETIIYTGTLEGEKYYVFLSEEGQLFHTYMQLETKINVSLKLLNDRIGAIIDELLRCQTSDVGKLDRNCVHMIRLKRYITVAINDTVEKKSLFTGRAESLLSVNVLLGCVISMCNDMLPAYGYHIEYDMQRFELHYCDCNTKSFITLMCILLFNTISLSDNGIVKVGFFNHASQKMLGIELSTFSKLTENIRGGGITELTEILLGKKSFPFVLELMVSAEITKALGWKIQFTNIDSEFRLKIDMPEIPTDVSRIQLRANSPEFDYTQMIIREFIADLD